MAYTDPPTFVAGDVLAASELNVVGDDIRYLYAQGQGLTFSGVSLARGSAQSIPDSADTDIVWLSETFDYGGYWSTGTTITIPSGAIPSGYTSVAFIIAARFRYATNGTGQRRIVIYKNGSELTRRSVAALNGDTTDVDIWRAFTCVAGDEITIAAYQDSGVALNLTPAGVELLRYAPAS